MVPGTSLRLLTGRPQNWFQQLNPNVISDFGNSVESSPHECPLFFLTLSHFSVTLKIFALESTIAISGSTEMTCAGICNTWTPSALDWESHMNSESSTATGTFTFTRATVLVDWTVPNLAETLGNYAIAEVQLYKGQRSAVINQPPLILRRSLSPSSQSASASASFTVDAISPGSSIPPSTHKRLIIGLTASLSFAALILAALIHSAPTRFGFVGSDLAHDAEAMGPSGDRER
ncbi:hypothetical protein K438DRAFT_1754034 [Mycena galopus ATCC 62051]|nr:hypothetical protein K438DRAFT_1754034 [Mycena galopus ATCC 62051]